MYLYLLTVKELEFKVCESRVLRFPAVALYYPPL